MSSSDDTPGGSLLAKVAGSLKHIENTDVIYLPGETPHPEIRRDDTTLIRQKKVGKNQRALEKGRGRVEKAIKVQLFRVHKDHGASSPIIM